FAVDDPNDPHALNLAELKRSIETVNDTWFVSAHLPITWETRIVGRLGAYMKRAVRVLLRWYINAIVEQQTRYNSHVARTSVDMGWPSLRFRTSGILASRSSLARLPGA